MTGGVRQVINRIGVFAAVLLIRAYQMLLAPLLVGGGCRHHPSCSVYAIEALHRHGLRRGVVLAAKRLWRCRPGGSYGYDPVPDVAHPTLPGKPHAR